MSAATLRKGDRFVAYANERPANRVFFEITRVASDGSWADVKCFTWAVSWTKRQTMIDGRFYFPCEPIAWTTADFATQEADHMAKIREAARS